MNAILLSAISDGIFAAIAATGFSFICGSSRKVVPFSALLGAIGHGLRYYLMTYQGVYISTATFFAALLIGLLAMFFARKLTTPAEVISFPALLPMIPGMYAYRTILALVAFGKSEDNTMEVQQEFVVAFFRNGFTTLSVTMALAVGVTIPLLIFYEQSFTMTRQKRFRQKK